MQFNAPPRLTASNAGMPTISQLGRALLICSIACSSSGIPICGTSTRVPICKKLMYDQLSSCFRFTLYFKIVTSKYFSKIRRYSSAMPLSKSE